MANISASRIEDKASLNRLEKSLTAVGKDVTEAKNSQASLNEKIGNIDNTVNKNVERIFKLKEKFNESRSKKIEDQLSIQNCWY